MNDYKELIEELKRNGLSNGSRLGHHSGLCDDDADAIEQLVKERDAAIADLKTVALNCHEDYTFSACFACEHNSTCNGQPSSGCEFEWRGVGG